MLGYIILALALVSVVYVIVVYNKTVRLDQDVTNADKQIEVQLDYRFKLFDNLIKSVSKVMDFEKTTLKDVVELRNKAKEAESRNDTTEKMKAENEISKIAGNINVVFEQYPELKSTENVLSFQESIENTENKLAYAKQYYNDSVERFYSYKKSIPPKFVISLFGSLDKDHEYWGVVEEERKRLENYQVNF